jgi:putative ABC transport system ATP-binding protein
MNPVSTIARDATVGQFSVKRSPVIQVDRLDHFFGEGELKQQVLFDINFAINAGEIIILTGPSGSGKTTLLSLMGGLRSPQSGSLRMLNTELVGAAKTVAVEARRSCGYIFQAHNLHTSLTAQENVMMGLEVHGTYSRSQRRDLAIHMLEVVGLGARTQYYPASLSGGQKQRVAIARALVSHPQIVLADEPTAALDKKSGRDVVELMQKLAKEQGCTILMVTHDNRILDIADRIIYMEDGHLTAPYWVAIAHSPPPMKVPA